MEFFEVMHKRYSVRKFDPRPVEQAKIQKILEIARLAPTAVNRQPERMLVLQSPNDMEKLSKCTKYTFNAPAAIIVCADMDKAWIRPHDQENSSVIDASIVATYIMLTICNLDLGTCWVGYFNPASLAVEFNLPANIKPVAIFPFGYPAKDSAPSGNHAQRLPLDELVRFISL